MNRRVPNDTTVKYTVEPLLRYVVKRTTENEAAQVVEQVAMVGDIDDARQIAKSLTDYERRNPADAGVCVLNFGDVEIH